MTQSTPEERVILTIIKAADREGGAAKFVSDIAGQVSFIS